MLYKKACQHQSGLRRISRAEMNGKSFKRRRVEIPSSGTQAVDCLSSGCYCFGICAGAAVVAAESSERPGMMGSGGG